MQLSGIVHLLWPSDTEFKDRLRSLCFINLLKQSKICKKTEGYLTQCNEKGHGIQWNLKGSPFVSRRWYNFALMVATVKNVHLDVCIFWECSHRCQWLYHIIVPPTHAHKWKYRVWVNLHMQTRKSGDSKLFVYCFICDSYGDRNLTARIFAKIFLLVSIRLRLKQQWQANVLTASLESGGLFWHSLPPSHSQYSWKEISRSLKPFHCLFTTRSFWNWNLVRVKKWVFSSFWSCFISSGTSISKLYHPSCCLVTTVKYYDLRPKFPSKSLEN